MPLHLIYGASPNELRCHTDQSVASLTTPTLRLPKESSLELLAAYPDSLHTVSHLVIENRLHLPPHEREALQKLLRDFPKLTVLLGSPFSFDDEEDPFFTTAFLELGNLADQATCLTASHTPQITHLHFDSSYEMILALRKKLREDHQSGATPSLIDRLPKSERELLDRAFTQTPPPFVRETLIEAYEKERELIYIPGFQQDAFPSDSPIHLEAASMEPSHREWDELRRSRLFRYWEDRVLLRLFSTRFSGQLVFLSADRSLKGDRLEPSPFAGKVIKQELLKGASPLKPPEKKISFSFLSEDSEKKIEIARSISISDLEAFDQCPFRYAMERQLKIKAPEDAFAFPKILRGKLIHRILETAVKNKCDFETAWSEAKAHFADELAPLAPTLTLELKDNAARAFDHVSSHPLHQAWNTKDAEWSFEWRGFRGRVDRIVEHRETGHLVVIDYKTSSYLPSTSELQTGEAFALPIYLAAAKALLAPHQPLGGLMYWDLAKGELKVGLLSNQVDTSAFDLSPRSNVPIGELALTESLSRAIDRATHLAQEINKGDFSAKPKDTDFCRRLCGFKRSCGYLWME